MIFETKTTWRPSAHLKVTFGGEYNDVDLPQGDYITRLATLTFDIAFNTAWSWENFVQYDNVSCATVVLGTQAHEWRDRSIAGSDQ